MQYNRENTHFTNWMKRVILAEAVCVLILAAGVVRQTAMVRTNSDTVQNDYIKWVEFTVSYEALCQAYEWDVNTHNTEHPINWVELLSYTAARTGGEFGKESLKILEEAAQKLSEGETTIEKLTEKQKYYAYYREAYGAVLDGLLGEFEEEQQDADGNKTFVPTYGLKAFFPLAKGFDYNHYDDFGAGRSYGYKRRHLGHDMMGQTGTPIRII